MLKVGASGPSFQAQARSDSGPMNALRCDQDGLPGAVVVLQVRDDPLGVGVALMDDPHQLLVGQAGQLDEIQQIPLARPRDAQVVHQPGENLPRAGGPDRLVCKSACKTDQVIGVIGVQN